MRFYPTLAPVQALLERLGAARERPGQGLLRVGEVARLLLELHEDRMGMHRAVIRQDDHMLAIVANGILTLGIDHDRAIMAHLLLQPRMAVIPVGARLDDWEFVDEGGPRPDTGEANQIGRAHV